MVQMFYTICHQMNNLRWNNLRSFGDQVDRSNPQTTSSGNVQHTRELFSWSCSDGLRSKFEPRSCRQSNPGDFLAVKLLDWDITIHMDDDDGNWADPGATHSGRSCSSNGNHNDDGEGEEVMQGGEKATGKDNGIKDGKGKAKGKAKGKENCKMKGIAKQTSGGDDVSHAVALQLPKELYEVDSDTEGYLGTV
jgi:hypothetical protein